MGGGGLGDNKTAFGFEENKQLIYTPYNEEQIKLNSDSNSAIAIGDGAGGNNGLGIKGTQKAAAIALGPNAGHEDQGVTAISIGLSAGEDGQKN